MMLGRVIGTVWATEKEPSLEGLKMLVVREIDLEFKSKGKFVIAIDTVQAGVGEVVLIATGSSARQTAQTKDRPVDAVVMAVVDNLALSDPETLEREYGLRKAPIAAQLANQPEL